VPADPEELPGSMPAMLWQAALGLLEALRDAVARRLRRRRRGGGGGDGAP
jgi:hypothetical protein